MKWRDGRFSSIWAMLLALAMVAAACAGDPATDDTTDATTEGSDTTAGGDEPADPTAPPDEGSDTTAAPSDGAVSNPDTFVHAADDEPTSLDPAQVEAGEGGETVILQVYDRLVEFTPDGPDLIPGIAAEVPSTDNGGISEDGTVYTFTVREGVVDHEGNPVDATDVKYSWDRVLTMDLPESNVGLLSDVVASTEAPDAQTFVVTLNQPNAAFLNSVVTQSVASIMSEEFVEANGGVEAGTPNEFIATNPVGTGPYVFEAWNRGENMLFTVNQDYWGTPANLDLRIEIVPDPDVRVLGVRAGDYDTIETDPSFVGDVEGAEGVTVFQGEFLLEPIHIGFNLNYPVDELPDEDTVSADFFYDPLIRRAFNYAFDYDAFVNGALGGFGAPTPFYLPQGVLGYSEDLPVYSQDLAMAEQLFTEAGVWEEGFTVSVIAEGGNLFEIAALVLKDSLEGLNPAFTVNVLALAEAQFDEAHASDPVPYALWVKNADPFADPHAFQSEYMDPNGNWGQVHGMANGYQDPETISTMIDEASVITDPAEREAIYHELSAMFFDDPMWIIAGNEVAVMAYRDWVDGFVMNPLWPRPSLKFALFNKGMIEGHSNPRGARSGAPLHNPAVMR